MNSVGFEAHHLAAIEELRKDEARIESEFLRLVLTWPVGWYRGQRG